MDSVTLNEDLSLLNTGKTKDSGDKETMFPGLLSSLSGSCHSVTTKSLLKKEESKVIKEIKKEKVKTKVEETKKEEKFTAREKEFLNKKKLRSKADFLVKK